MYKNLMFYLGLVVIKGPMGICTNGPIKARLMHTTLGHFGYTQITLCFRRLTHLERFSCASPSSGDLDRG